MPMWYGLGMKSSISVSFRGAVLLPLLAAVAAWATPLATTRDRTTARRRRRDRARLLIVSSLAPGWTVARIYIYPEMVRCMTSRSSLQLAIEAYKGLAFGDAR